jgi:hypothetical protein
MATNGVGREKSPPAFGKDPPRVGRIGWSGLPGWRSRPPSLESKGAPSRSAGYAVPLPAVLGREGAGVVEAVGSADHDPYHSFTEIDQAARDAEAGEVVKPALRMDS